MRHQSVVAGNFVGDDNRLLWRRRPHGHFRTGSGGAADNGSRCIGADDGPCRSGADDRSGSPAIGPATDRDSDGFPPDGYPCRWWRGSGGDQHARTHADPGSGAGGTTQG